MGSWAGTSVYDDFQHPTGSQTNANYLLQSGNATANASNAQANASTKFAIMAASAGLPHNYQPL